MFHISQSFHSLFSCFSTTIFSPCLSCKSRCKLPRCCAKFPVFSVLQTQALECKLTVRSSVTTSKVGIMKKEQATDLKARSDCKTNNFRSSRRLIPRRTWLMLNHSICHLNDFILTKEVNPMLMHNLLTASHSPWRMWAARVPHVTAHYCHF